jgi:hypothetical protein
LQKAEPSRWQNIVLYIIASRPGLSPIGAKSVLVASEGKKWDILLPGGGAGHFITTNINEQTYEKSPFFYSDLVHIVHEQKGKQ